MASMSPDTALTVRTRRDVIVAAHLSMGSQVKDDKTLTCFTPDVHAQYLLSVTVPYHWAYDYRADLLDEHLKAAAVRTRCSFLLCAITLLHSQLLPSSPSVPELQQAVPEHG